MPSRPLQGFCSVDCGVALAKRLKDRKAAQTKRREAQDTRKRLKDLEPKEYWLKKAQNVFNTWVRMRDYKAGYGCISCGTKTAVQYHAGHYRSRGAIRALRFEPLNCHLQCSQCNDHKGSNAIEYRINLVKRIGIERVEWLEGPHEPLKLTIPQIQAVIEHYRILARQLNAE